MFQVDIRCQPPGSIAYCPLAQSSDATRTTNFWLIPSWGDWLHGCSLCNWPGAPSDSSRAGKYVSFSGSIWCKHSNSKQAAFNSAIKEREKKLTLLAKWAASAQNLIPRAQWANCPLLQFVNNSDDSAFFFCRLENRNTLPARRFTASLSHRCTDIACQLLKRVSDCLSLFGCLLKQLFHQSKPPSCVLVVPIFFYLFIFLFESLLPLQPFISTLTIAGSQKTLRYRGRAGITVSMQ